MKHPEELRQTIAGVLRAAGAAQDKAQVVVERNGNLLQLR